ncbi:MAG: AMP-binding protein [Rhodospirillales bacterium]|nr:MAG: AMP-binding protein [Rhodospirillales bacterium]
MNLANLLDRAGRGFASRPALASGTRTLCDYRALARRAGALAGGLRDRFGLGPGDRVALVMRNSPEYVELLFACWHAGLIAVPVNAKLAAAEFQFILTDSGARVCVVSADLAATIGGLAGPEAVVEIGSGDWCQVAAAEPATLVETAPDDVAWLFYTSGTTGRPKGAMITHRNLMAMCWGYFADVDSIAPVDSIVHAAPMSHGSGLYILPHVIAGALQVVPESGGFEPDELHRLCDAHHGATVFAAPTMVRRMVAHAEARGAAPAGLKAVVYGGGPMYVEDGRKAIALFGGRLAQIYGQGESPMTITSLARHRFPEPAEPRFEARLGSAGIAFGIVELRVAGADDGPLPPGETGEVLVRGDPVMRGYWNNAAATAETLRGGWLHTGDVGVLDADGYLALKDRSKDVIISGGANIYPREVEEALLAHPRVQEVSVIGQPDPEWGERVIAFVVAAPGAEVSADELDRLCLDRIARFKRPRAYRFVDALPKNNYGKVLKTALREMIAAEPA